MKIDLGNYTVSSTGIVLNTKSGKRLGLTTDKLGYRRVSITINGVRKAMLVHRLVAMIYLPNPDNLPVVNHKDGNPYNNCVSNLEWCTHKHNSKHAVEIGAIKSGADNYQAKLTYLDALWVRANYVPRHRLLGVRGLARKYGTAPSVISDIINNKTYKEP